MKRLSIALVLLLTALLAAAPALADGRKIAFIRWSGHSTQIWTAGEDGKNAAKLISGFDPEISPDGTRVAYTYSDKSGGRFIAVCDIKTRKTTVLRSIPGSNSYGPRWSPDGKKLLFNHFMDGSKWTVCTWDLAARRYKIFRLPKGSTDGVYSPFWSHDGSQIFANDFSHIVTFDAASGKSVAVMSIIDIVDRASILMSSAAQFACSPDGKSWLIREENGNESCALCSAFDGPGLKGTMFLFDVNEKKTTRVSPKEYCVASAVWRGGDIFFTGHRESEKPKKGGSPDGIYRLSPDTGKVTLLLMDGSQISVSSPN